MNIDEQRGCGYCINEASCLRRSKYMSSGERKRGGTAELAANCDKFTHFNQKEGGE